MVKGVLCCDPNTEDAVVFVSKVFAADREVALPARSIAHIRYVPHFRSCHEYVKLISDIARVPPRTVRPPVERPMRRPLLSSPNPASKVDEHEPSIRLQRQERGPSNSDDDRRLSSEENQSVKRKENEGNQEGKPKDPPRDQLFVAFARIFSGTLRVGQKVHVLGPRYDPKYPERYRTGS